MILCISASPLCLHANADPPGDREASTQLVQQFDARRRGCDADDQPQLLKLASWAVDHNLLNQADDLYRRMLDEDPDASEAYHGLMALAQQRALSADSEVYMAVRSILPPSFIEYESKHFIVISNAESVWSRRQLELLERTHNQFQRFASRLKLRPLPLQHKLVCVLFVDREQYRRFARQHDHVENAWITGYYSPLHDWIVFYDPQFSPEVMQARSRLQELQHQVEELKRQASAVAAAQQSTAPLTIHDDLTRTQQTYEQQRRRIDEYAAREGAATTIHEAAHQLLFHTRVQRASVRYPLWICEGLATSFETETPLEPFGPDHEYVARRNRFRELLRADKLIPLRDLVQIDRVTAGDSEDRIDAIYQESYALVTWLNRGRKDELRLYLYEMRRQPAGELPGMRHRELFEEAFGDLDDLERAWLRFEKNQLGAAPNALH